MRNIITMRQSDWQAIESRLIRHGGVEHLFAGLVTVNSTPERREFFLKTSCPPHASDYLEQSPWIVTVTPDFMAKLFVKSKPYSGILLWHNHIGRAFPSTIDNQQIKKTIQNVHDFRLGNYVLRGIWGCNGLFAEVTNAELGRWIPIDTVKVIGDERLDLVSPINAPKRNPEEVDVERHNRTLNYLGDRGENTLDAIRNLKWGFVGAGGVMSAFLNTLKFLGPKRCVIVDGDQIERSNANRLFGYRDGDDGTSKVEVARRELNSFDPDMEIEVVNAFLPSQAVWSALKACDVLVCGPDNDFCRYLVAEFASRYWKVLLDFGSGIRLNKETGLPAKVGSQARLQLPTKDGRCLACLGLETENLIHPKIEADIRQSGLEVGYIQDSDLPTPTSVVTINAVIAAVGVRMLLSYLSGIGKTPTYLEYDELELQFRDLSHVFDKCPACSICGDGEASIFGWGDNLPESLRVIAPVQSG